MAVHAQVRQGVHAPWFRRDLLLSASLLAVFAGQGRAAYAQYCAGPGTYVCTGTGSQPIVLTGTDIDLIADGVLQVDATGQGGSAVSINGDGTLGFGMYPGADIYLKGDTAAVSIISSGDLTTGQVGVNFDAAGVFKGQTGIYGRAVGANGSIAINLSSGSVIGTGPGSTGITAFRTGPSGDVTVSTGSGTNINNVETGIHGFSNTTSGQMDISVDGEITSGLYGIRTQTRGSVSVSTGQGSSINAVAGIVTRITGSGDGVINVDGSIRSNGQFGIALEAGRNAGNIAVTTGASSFIQSSTGIGISSRGAGSIDVSLSGYIYSANLAGSALEITSDSVTSAGDIRVTAYDGSRLNGVRSGIKVTNDAIGSDTIIVTGDDVGARFGAGIRATSGEVAKNLVIATAGSPGTDYGIAAVNNGSGYTYINVNTAISTSGQVATGILAQAKNDLTVLVGQQGEVDGGLVGILAASAGPVRVEIDGGVNVSGPAGAGIIALSTANDVYFLMGSNAVVSVAGRGIDLQASGDVFATVNGTVTATNGAALGSQTTNGVNRISIGATANIASAEGSAVQLSGTSDVELAGSVSATKGAAILFDQSKATNDSLILNEGWELTGWADAGLGSDTLTLGTGADLGTIAMGGGASVRNFENVTGTTGAQGRVTIENAQLTWDATAAQIGITLGSGGKLLASGQAGTIEVGAGGELTFDGTMQANTVSIRNGGAGRVW